jgi:hypothetical protein
VARNGPPGDFHNEPTRHANYGMGGEAPVEEPQSAAPVPDAPGPLGDDDFVDSLGREAEPTPWYRRPVLLAAWLLLVLVLIGLIVFGIVELLHGNEGTTPTPTTSTTTPTTTESTTTTPPTTTSATTTPSTPPPASTAEPPPQQQQPGQQPTRQQPTHRHHLPELPPVISIPGVPTPITVPPGLR